jgi:hypothetical protein
MSAMSAAVIWVLCSLIWVLDSLTNMSAGLTHSYECWTHSLIWVLDSLTHMSAGLTHSYECGGRRRTEDGGRRRRRKVHSHKGVFHSLINSTMWRCTTEWTRLSLHEIFQTVFPSSVWWFYQLSQIKVSKYLRIPLSSIVPSPSWTN